MENGKSEKNRFCEVESAIHPYIHTSIPPKGFSPEQKEEALKILSNLGYEQFKQRNYAAAIVYYTRYIEISQTNPLIYNMLGYFYQKLAKYQNIEEQIKYFEKALELKPNYVQAIRNLALAYPLVERYQEAIECFHKLFELGPITDDYMAYACLQIRLKNFEEGWKHYEYRFLKEFSPTEYPKIDKPKWEGQNISDKTLLVQYEQGYGDSIQFFRYLEQVKPLVKKIIFRVQDGLVDLFKITVDKELKEFRDNAKKYYQNNLQGQIVKNPHLGEIKFTGKGVKETLYRNPPKGREFSELKHNIENAHYIGSEDVCHERKDKIKKFYILEYNNSQYLIAEEGNIKKYYLTKNVLDNRLPMKNRGDFENNNIITNYSENFNPKTNINNIEVVGISTSLEELPLENLYFDYHVALMSLPHVMNARVDNIPLAQGYIKADEKKIETYKKEFFNNDCFKIGISWNGTKLGNNYRNVPLKYFYPLTKLKNVEVYSFQKGFGAEQLKNMAPNVEIINLGQTFNDFSDTAAAMANLDLFVTSDNSVFNLAGAMGVRTFVLLNKHAEWRWFLDEETTPWYDNVKIFKKQNEDDDWDLLIQKVIKTLKKESEP